MSRPVGGRQLVDLCHRHHVSGNRLYFLDSITISHSQPRKNVRQPLGFFGLVVLSDFNRADDRGYGVGRTALEFERYFWMGSICVNARCRCCFMPSPPGNVQAGSLSPFVY